MVDDDSGELIVKREALRVIRIQRSALNVAGAVDREMLQPRKGEPSQRTPPIMLRRPDQLTHPRTPPYASSANRRDRRELRCVTLLAPAPASGAEELDGLEPVSETLIRPRIRSTCVAPNRLSFCRISVMSFTSGLRQ